MFNSINTHHNGVTRIHAAAISRPQMPSNCCTISMCPPNQSLQVSCIYTLRFKGTNSLRNPVVNFLEDSFFRNVRLPALSPRTEIRACTKDSSTYRAALFNAHTEFFHLYRIHFSTWESGGYTIGKKKNRISHPFINSTFAE